MKHEAKPVRHREAFSPTALLALLVLLLVACRLLTSVPGEIETQTVSSTLEPTFTPSPPSTDTPQPSPTATPTKPTPTSPPAEPTSTATPQPSLSGRILDQATDQPVVGAKVSAGTYTTTTDADGRYTVAGLPPGQYVLSVTHDDYDPGLSSIFTLAGWQEHSLDLALYAPGTTPYPQDPMLTNPLDPNGAPTAEDAERLARLQGLTGEIVSIQETKLSGQFLVNYKIGDEVRAALTEVRHEAWALTDDTGQKWWIIKVCGNLASRPGKGVVIPTPEPSPPPPVGKIAFLSNRDHLNDQYTPYELYIMNPDGSQQTRITTTGLPNTSSFLTWMPGYSQLFYEAGGPTWGIINLLDKTPVPWQPLIPVRVNNEIQVVGVNWSPDGQNIAYINSHFERLSVVGADGNNQRLVFEAGEGEQLGFPFWSPDGRKIAFSSRSKVHTISPDGSDLVTVADTWGRVISWSPDATRIAFECGKPGVSTYWSQDICVVNVDGTGLVDLANTKDIWEWHPTWSPDGEQIAFQTMAYISGAETPGQIYVISADGTDLTQLTFEGNNCCPAWSR